MAEMERDFRTPLARARGLGSAKDGTRHWWAQRVTAIALIPLTVWLAFSAMWLAGASYSVVVTWASSPVVAAGLILFTVALFYHLALGIQVVVEDYVHHEGAKITTLLLVNFASFAAATGCILAILYVALGASGPVATVPV